MPLFEMTVSVYCNKISQIILLSKKKNVSQRVIKAILQNYHLFVFIFFAFLLCLITNMDISFLYLQKRVFLLHIMLYGNSDYNTFTQNKIRVIVDVHLLPNVRANTIYSAMLHFTLLHYSVHDHNYYPCDNYFAMCVPSNYFA